MQCTIYANTAMGCHTARAQVGPINTAVTIPHPLSAATQPPKDVSGIETTAHAPAGKPIKRHMEKHLRPDYRQECQQTKRYRCLHAFMGSFNQSACWAFVIDPQCDKCLYQAFNGECKRREE